MLKINETFKVRALFPCHHVTRFESSYEHDPVWRQTVLGCMLLEHLQTMFQFNITYPNDDFNNMTKEAQREALYPRGNDSVDIYVRPMSLQADILAHAYPIQATFLWRFGFILRRQRNDILRTFYSQPFNTPVWICIHTMIFLGSLIFYVLSWWDSHLFGIECNYFYELLLAYSAYCQHILPLQALSCSRRIAYLSFILCAYVVHSFYTSNLLSHLVNDKDEILDLHYIVNNNYQIALLKDMNLDTDKDKYERALDKNLSIVWHKVLQLKMLDIKSALEAVMNSNTALLTDYITLYPVLKRHFEGDKICQLEEIDLYSNVKSYFFTSKNFSYKEEFKISILRAKEVGLFRRIMALDKYKPNICEQATTLIQAHYEHMITPMIILIAAHFLALLILFSERIHYNRNRVWPYVN